jgi:transposase
MSKRLDVSDRWLGEARMIKTHLPNILTYFMHGISNAVVEDLNEKIQTVKSNVREHRSFDGIRSSIQFPVAVGK